SACAGEVTDGALPEGPLGDNSLGADPANPLGSSGAANVAGGAAATPDGAGTAGQSSSTAGASGAAGSATVPAAGDGSGVVDVGAGPDDGTGSPAADCTQVDVAPSVLHRLTRLEYQLSLKELFQLPSAPDVETIPEDSTYDGFRTLNEIHG